MVLPHCQYRRAVIPCGNADKNSNCSTGEGIVIKSPFPDTYSCCTRCGGRVDPYSANGEGHWVVGEQHNYYGLPVTNPGDFPGFSKYRCQACEAQWLALNWSDTGNEAACGHFMPQYV